MVGASGGHSWDLVSEFCTRCGCATTDYVNGLRPVCPGTPNVTAISHVLYRKRIKELSDESSQKGKPEAS